MKIQKDKTQCIVYTLRVAIGYTVNRRASAIIYWDYSSFMAIILLQLSRANISSQDSKILEIVASNNPRDPRPHSELAFFFTCKQL